MNDSSRRKRHTYSVFVGHLPKDVTREELLELFGECGGIEDCHVVSPKSETFNFTHGFVRYWKLEDAEKAVCELHRWKLRNMILEVELSHDTRQRVKEGKERVNEKEISKDVQARDKVDFKKPTTNYVEDLMYLSRLKECCVDVNADVMQSEGSGRKPVKVDQLLDGISRATKKRPAAKEIVPVDAIASTTEMERIKNKLVTKYSQSVTSTRKKQKEEAEFLESLHNIMETIKTLVADKEVDLKSVSETSHCRSDSTDIRKSADSPELSLPGAILDSRLLGKSSDTISREDSMESVESIDVDTSNNVDSGVETDATSATSISNNCRVESKHKHCKQGALLALVESGDRYPMSSGCSPVKMNNSSINPVTLSTSQQRGVSLGKPTIEGVDAVQSMIDKLMVGRGRGLKFQK